MGGITPDTKIGYTPYFAQDKSGFIVGIKLPSSIFHFNQVK